MSLRSRRLLAIVAVIVVLLFAGRWIAGYVTERWWARTLSPSVESFVDSWQLLGLALDAVAVLIASLWFAVQALLVIRSVVSVQLAHRVGDVQLREIVPARVLVGAAIASGVLLGLIAGTGAHAWREPIVLAWQGVHYGVRDPLLGRDLGVYIAQLPAWDLAQRFAMLLAFLALALCTTLYSAIGGIRRSRWSLALHPDAQRHLGSLLAIVALVIAATYQLTPFHLVVHATPTTTPADVLLRVHGAQVMSGLAIAAAVLTAWWAFRGRGALLVSTWLVLGAGALIEAVGLPAASDTVAPLPSRLAEARQLDAIAWGIHLAPPEATADTVPRVTAVWDDAVLSRVVEQRGAVLEAATPSVSRNGSRGVASWLVASTPAADSQVLNIFSIPVGDSTAAIGSSRPDDSRPNESSIRILDPRTRPSAGSWSSVSTGVDAGGPARRLLLAWARQAPGMLQRLSAPAVDWHLDPAERAAAVFPMLSWTASEVAMVGARPTWVVQGMSVTPDFPLASHATWQDADIAGAVPAIICTVDVASGATRFYADPAADSLGAAWARLAGPTVAPATALPAPIRNALRYDPAWFNAQAAVLAAPAWNMGRRAAGGDSAAMTAPVWTFDDRPAREAAFEDPVSDVVTALATGYRADGEPQLRIATSEASDAIAESPAQLRQLWARMPDFQHLRDSVVAAGDSVLVGPLRWFAGRAGFAAWQPWFARTRRGGATLIWISSALGDRAGGGRRPSLAWAAVTSATPVLQSATPDAAALIGSAREWMARADSALRRGDMTAFGRAFEALRRTLQGSPEP